MKVNRSAYYTYARQRTYREIALKVACTVRVKECFELHRRRYGTRRIAAELQIGRSTARKIMRRENLRAIQPKSFTPKTTDSKHGLPIGANLLQNGANAPVGKGEVLVGDITCLRLAGGTFCYLACLQDKFTRRIVGWKVSERMTAQLVIDVFLQARRRGLITDQGSQYAAVEYRRLLYIGGFRQSMSRKGNCYDNAQAESFFSRFKAELVEGGIFESIEDAKSEVFSYIEGYYNRIRLHSGLNYQSPLQFENELKLKNKMRSSESFVS
jgi:transposase InsO family protein